MLNNYNVFSEIKSRVDIFDIATRYGVQVGRNGMCRCPFHAEKTPSFKLFEKTNSFFCFGCGEHGDAIALCQKLCKLRTPLEAARQLNTDFSLQLDLQPHRETSQERKERIQAQREKQLEKAAARALDSWIERSACAVVKYSDLIAEWIKRYAPERMGKQPHPLFEEALRNRELVEYLRKIFEENDTKEILKLRAGFFGAEVDRIAKRIRDYESAQGKP